MINKNIDTLSETTIAGISSKHIHSVDKFYRMFAGLASHLERYEKDIIYLRIENTEKKLPSNYKTALDLAKCWWIGNKELSHAKGFVVSFYGTKSTGVVFNYEELKDEGKIKQAVEELKSAGKQKSELINIFSGTL